MLNTKKLAFVFATFALLVVGGCSTMRIAYNNAPSLASWYLDTYFDLSEDQRELARVRLDSFFVWHRKAEMPQLKRLLVDFDSRLNKTLTPEDLNAIYSAGRDRYKTTADQALPDVAEFLLTLSPNQIAQLERKLEKDNLKREKESSKPLAERTKKRGEKIIEEMVNICGEVSAEQKAAFLALNEKMPDIEKMAMTDRRFRQREFIKLLKTHTSVGTVNISANTDGKNATAKQAIVSGVRRLMFEQETWRDASYAAVLKTREQLDVEMTVNFAKTMTPAQRANAKKKIGSYLEDVNALIAM